jgi:hypothetical protein
MTKNLFYNYKIIKIQRYYRKYIFNKYNSVKLLHTKGLLCSINGAYYENKIFNIVKNCKINGITFNTQTNEQLGGSSSYNDIQCNFNSINDIGIEVKKYNTPDWMQCSIKYDNNINQWIGTKQGKIPKKSTELFNKLINNINIFDGDIPPFMEKPITHNEWLLIKKNTTKWNDKYVDIPDDTIRQLYNFKGCSYIQISDGYGLYHLGNDICNFNVPIFNIEQHIRIRTKIHKRKNKKGFCSLSVIIACQPLSIKSFIKSPYSLDDINKLPMNLTYNINQL